MKASVWIPLLDIRHDLALLGHGVTVRPGTVNAGGVSGGAVNRTEGLLLGSVASKSSFLLSAHADMLHMRHAERTEPDTLKSLWQ